jgi:7-carboxy-7-deazaguanine synthase
MFVRFGYCDYRCSWCDSMFAVEPSEVREHAKRMTANQIVREAVGRPAWVTLSGGNPAIHDLTELVTLLQEMGCYVAVETQGSVWRDWLKQVDHLVVSPKPPSSGMATSAHRNRTDAFLAKASGLDRARRSLKIVVFNQADLDWARTIIEWRKDEMEWWDSYLSVGTDPPEHLVVKGGKVVVPESIDKTIGKISRRYRWLCEAVAGDPVLAYTRVLPQLHVIAWGHARGV